MIKTPEVRKAITALGMGLLCALAVPSQLPGENLASADLHTSGESLLATLRETPTIIEYDRSIRHYSATEDMVVGKDGELRVRLVNATVNGKPSESPAQFDAEQGRPFVGVKQHGVVSTDGETQEVTIFSENSQMSFIHDGKTSAIQRLDDSGVPLGTESVLGKQPVQRHFKLTHYGAMFVHHAKLSTKADQVETTEDGRETWTISRATGRTVVTWQIGPQPSLLGFEYRDSQGNPIEMVRFDDFSTFEGMLLPRKFSREVYEAGTTTLVSSEEVEITRWELEPEGLSRDLSAPTEDAAKSLLDREAAKVRMATP